MPIHKADQRSEPILPHVTIKVDQVTVVHQTVLSFDHFSGNLNQQSFSNFASLGHELLARPLSVCCGDERASEASTKLADYYCELTRNLDLEISVFQLLSARCPH